MPESRHWLNCYHIFVAQAPLDEIDYLDPGKIFPVQLADFMWQENRTFEERMTTARTFRVFPGEGVHSEQLVDLVLRCSVPLPNQMRLRTPG